MDPTERKLAGAVLTAALDPNPVEAIREAALVLADYLMEREDPRGTWLRLGATATTPRLGPDGEIRMEPSHVQLYGWTDSAPRPRVVFTVYGNNNLERIIRRSGDYDPQGDCVLPCPGVRAHPRQTAQTIIVNLNDDPVAF